MKLQRVDLGGGIVLGTAQAGFGGSPLLLLHGFTGAKEDFADWLDPLADRGFHVVAPDLRGHGASSQPSDEAAYSLDRFAADALALVDTLGWGRFALLGHSMGGMVAQLLALSSDRLTALVLMDTCSGPVKGVAPDLAALAIEVARTQGLDVLADLQNELQSPLDTGADARVRAERPGYVEFGERKLRTASPAMYAALVAEMTSIPDRLRRLAELTVPTLVVVGEEDENFIDSCREMAAVIRSARLVVLADAGHSPQFEAPEAWWDAIHPFLEATIEPPG